jgi:hypothetical protein
MAHSRRYINQLRRTKQLVVLSCGHEGAIIKDCDDCGGKLCRACCESGHKTRWPEERLITNRSEF